MTERETAYQIEERRALLGDRGAVLRIVSMLRDYRRHVSEMLDKRYSDGECDSFTLTQFADRIAEVEQIAEVE